MLIATGQAGPPRHTAAAPQVVACADGYERFDMVPISGGRSGRFGRGRRTRNLIAWLATNDAATLTATRAYRSRSRVAPIAQTAYQIAPCSPSFEYAFTKRSTPG